MNLLAELEAAFSAAAGAGGIVAAGTFADELDAAFAGMPADDGARDRQRAKRERDATGEAWEPLGEEHAREYDRQYSAKRGAAKRKRRLEFIAVLDMETDPFDSDARDRIYPFAACLYSDQFDPIMIWEDDHEIFISRVYDAIAALPDSYTIYAHNGGRFDFMFLISRLRGRVSFKGRGIMAASIGPHELRDSFHLIPEALASYRKDEFDYSKMHRKSRDGHKAEIQKYLLNDCVYLFDIVKSFLTSYGMKISIGQAAMHLLKKTYKECENLNALEDEFVRQFFYGGRVECLGGMGTFSGDYKLFDVNSMYPDVMANCTHPIGRKYTPRANGAPSGYTAFVDLNCYSRGAFPVKVPNEGTQFPHAFGRYRVTIHEYRSALELNLIENVKINYCLDNNRFTSFDDFILPLYHGRIATKEKLAFYKANGLEGTDEFYSAKKDDTFLKLLQNNAYGKFAQNPRRFKEYYLTDWNGRPDDEQETWGEFPEELCSDYAIWSRPIQELRFNNVGTAASITGAARAKLLRAIHGAVKPIYCDTDSLICEALTGQHIHPSALGAWDIEANISDCLIAGKKLYAYRTTAGAEKIKSKGVKGLAWRDMERLIGGERLTVNAFAPTLTRTGQQRYIDRRISATAKDK